LTSPASTGNIGEMNPRLTLFPETAEANSHGHLVIGGCDTIELADEFGTPLYIFDEAGLRRRCAEFKKEFRSRYENTAVVYAAKAFLNGALAILLRQEGLGLDVVSGGELGVAQSVGFPLEKVYFHGNNKSADELGKALRWGVGRVVVDNFQELAMLDGLAGKRGSAVDILLRITPGVEPHTHRHISTGVVDSKFGFPLAEGDKAVSQAMEAGNLNLIGLHFHIGSSIFEIEPYRQAVGIILDFAADMKRKHNMNLDELDIGGGFAIQYLLSSPAPPVSEYAEVITGAVSDRCRQLKMPLPKLVIEPGRSIVGRSGVALYTVGVVKDIPGVRRYVSVDGGMGDNIRPALYEAEYEAVVADKMNDEDTEKITIAGRYCESGDVLVRDIALPPVEAGDIIAIPGCGAYCIPQASNFNASLKPAVVLVNKGRARLIRRRETFADLTKCDVV